MAVCLSLRLCFHSALVDVQLCSGIDSSLLLSDRINVSQACPVLMSPVLLSSAGTALAALLAGMWVSVSSAGPWNWGGVGSTLCPWSRHKYNTADWNLEIEGAHKGKYQSAWVTRNWSLDKLPASKSFVLTIITENHICGKNNIVHQWELLPFPQSHELGLEGIMWVLDISAAALPGVVLFSSLASYWAVCPAQQCSQTAKAEKLLYVPSMGNAVSSERGRDTPNDFRKAISPTCPELISGNCSQVMMFPKADDDLTEVSSDGAAKM